MRPHTRRQSGKAWVKASADAWVAPGGAARAGAESGPASTTARVEDVIGRVPVADRKKEEQMEQFKLAIVLMAVTESHGDARDAHGRRRVYTAAELAARADVGWHLPDVRGFVTACRTALRVAGHADQADAFLGGAPLDSDRFAAITRVLPTDPSRRQRLTRVVGGGVATLLALLQRQH